MELWHQQQQQQVQRQLPETVSDCPHGNLAINEDCREKKTIETVTSNKHLHIVSSRQKRTKISSRTMFMIVAAQQMTFNCIERKIIKQKQQYKKAHHTGFFLYLYSTLC